MTGYCEIFPAAHNINLLEVDRQLFLSFCGCHGGSCDAVVVMVVVVVVIVAVVI